MILRLERKYKKETYTIGALLLNGEKLCDTIEDKDRGLNSFTSLAKIRKLKVKGKTAIPTGTYEISLDFVSPKFKNRSWAIPYGGVVPRLKNVPGFTGILIHPFNTADESQGCIGPGENRAKGMVLNSTATYLRLMKDYLWPAKARDETIFITIS